MSKVNIKIKFTPNAQCKIASCSTKYVWDVSKLKFQKCSYQLSTAKKVATLFTQVKLSLHLIKFDVIQKNLEGRESMTP